MKNTAIEYQKAQQTFRDLIGAFLLAGIPIPVRSIDPDLVLTNSLTQLGSCRKKDGRYTIRISSHILGDPLTVRNTLAHELVHTCKGCLNHGRTFYRIAGMVEDRLGIPVHRTATQEESQRSGIRDAYREKARYRIRCQTCGTETYRQKKSALVMHPERYRCSKCGGRLRAEVL